MIGWHACSLPKHERSPARKYESSPSIWWGGPMMSHVPPRWIRKVPLMGQVLYTQPRHSSPKVTTFLLIKSQPTNPHDHTSCPKLKLLNPLTVTSPSRLADLGSTKTTCYQKKPHQPTQRLFPRPEPAPAALDWVPRSSWVRCWWRERNPGRKPVEVGRYLRMIIQSW